MNNPITIGNILIIDDERVNAEAMSDILEDVNYNVVLAASAAEAKAIVKTQTFDLVMMDVWMPGQDGMSLLEEWIGQNFKMPIVMMSGHAQHQDVVQAIKLGAYDFLQKPLHDILSFVRGILSAKDNNNPTKITSKIEFNAPLKTARNRFEMQYFLHHLIQNNYNITKVAKIAGLERTTLYRKLKDLGIDKK